MLSYPQPHVGPQDLYFPEDFLGIWTTESTLTNVDIPLGAEFVPDMKVLMTLRCLSSGGIRYQDRPCLRWSSGLSRRT